MVRTVFRATIVSAVFVLSAYGCGGGNSTSDNGHDGGADVAGDTIGTDSQDSVDDNGGREDADTISPTDTHDANTDAGRDIPHVDSYETKDLVEEIDAVDASDTADDGAELPPPECLIDDDCAGKLTLQVCQVPKCTSDNVCEAVNAPNDTECNDNLLCTTDEHCLDGQCVGGPVDCNDNLECTQDLCDEANYCFHRPYYGLCNDGNACTENDNCSSGSCVGTEINCNDSNDCTTDTCDTKKGCLHEKLSGIRCNDNNLCTISDTCVNGTCIGTNNCDDADPCTDDGCNELGCTHAPKTGGQCNDGQSCTENDTCQQGTCTGTPIVCNDQNECTDDYCQEGLGCRTRFNTNACNDGNPCTRNDRCQYGTCTGTSYSCPVMTCMSANNCDGSGGCVPVYSDYGTPCTADTNPCTDDICSQGACIHPNSATGKPCNDNNSCTRTDECSNGACVGRNPIVCSVQDACKDPGTCDPATGTCTLGVLPEGSSCDDRNLCTRFDKCVGGTCTGTAKVCPAINDCHKAGTCNPDDGTCNEVFQDNGTLCNDSNACTRTDTCQDGVCVGGNPVVCQPLDGCHLAGVCQGNGQCTNPIAPNNTSCDDGNPCTSTDTCTNGFCAGIAYTCNDNLSCTDDSCDGLGGCINDVQEGWCRLGGVCLFPGSVHPSNGCQVCDPDSSRTEWTPVDGGFCDDYDQCTINDTCVSGFCSGDRYSCDDGIPCTIDTCDGLGGCINSIAPGSCLINGACYTNGQQDPTYACRTCNIMWSVTQFTPRAEGEGCDDGAACTWNDKCFGGTCSGQPYSCSDGLACTADVCAGDGTCRFVIADDHCVIDGNCVAANTQQPGNACGACLPGVSKQFWSPYREGQSCDDGSICTVSDKCASGDCIGRPKCDDEIDCTTDTCDTLGNCANTVNENYCAINGNCYFFGEQEGQNQCSRCIPTTDNRHWTATDGGDCDDQDPCTLNDICVGDSCVGIPKVCNDGLDCTTDFCQYELCGAVPLAGWCIIDNQCILSGTPHPTNTCLICDSTENPYAWSYNNGIPCNDLDQCSYNDQCFAGVCAGQSYDCNDGVPCTVDQCTGTGLCDYSVAPGQCLIAGGCYADGDPNIANQCEHCDTALTVSAWSAHDAIACDDTRLCTKNDTCINRQCVGTPYGCDDGLVCTADACLGDGTCSHQTIGGWCLINGACVRDQTRHPSNICLACLSSVTTTEWSPNNGLPCDDNEICTKLDTCSGGTCTGTQYACDDGLACTSDACDGGGGCIATLNAGYCLINNKCYATNSPNPDNICEKCSPATSTTEWSFNNGMFCNDFDSCSINDVCTDGVCSGEKYSCIDGVECTLDLCDGEGGCSNPLAPNACFINNICYWEGNPKPGVPCEACVPRTSQDSWTELNPGAIEICNGIDDNCDGTLDPENAPGCVNYYKDSDGDGVGITTDYRCLCKATGMYRTIVPGDCDDAEPLVYSGREESCDGLDNDCDGVTDPANTFGCQVFYVDGDSDNYGVSTSSRCLCAASGFYRTTKAGDCKDNDDLVNPMAAEICNGKDDNCDGRTDPPDTDGCVRYYLDTDKDTWGDSLLNACLCQPTAELSATRGQDCDDFDPDVNPDKVDICNNKDDDCSGFTDDSPITTLCPHNPASLVHAAMICRNTCFVECEPENIMTNSPAWYDFDSNITNGCECQGDQFELVGGATAESPFFAGALPDDGTLALFDGRLSVPAQEDWFRVDGLDPDWLGENEGCDTFNFTVFLKTNPSAEYEMDVYRRVEAGGSYFMELLCGGIQKWDFATNFIDANLGECPCDNRSGINCEGPNSLAECKRVHGTDWVNYCNACAPGEGIAGGHKCTDNSRTVYVKIRRKAGVTAHCTGYQLEVSNGYYEYVLQ